MKEMKLFVSFLNINVKRKAFFACDIENTKKNNKLATNISAVASTWCSHR